MVHLVKRLLPIPEVRGSNPVFGKNSYRTFSVNCIEKTKKRPGMAHLKNKCFSEFNRRKMYLGDLDSPVDKDDNFVDRCFWVKPRSG